MTGWKRSTSIVGRTFCSTPTGARASPRTCAASWRICRGALSGAREVREGWSLTGARLLRSQVVPLLARECRERALVRNVEGAAFESDQAVVLEAREGARNHLSHRADARRDLLVGVREFHAQSNARPLAFSARLVEQKAREALADFAERQSLDQFGAAPEPTGEHFERGQGDLRMLDAEPPHVAPVNEECARLLFGGDA